MTSKRILIVDDEPNIRMLLCRIFEKAGYRCVLAIDGVEAVEHLATGAYDAIVLDLMMPRLDGFGVIGYMQENDASMLARTVVATAYPRAAEANGLRAVCRVVPKPFELADLLGAVAACAA